VSLIDPECGPLVRAFQRRSPRRPPAFAQAARDPMFKRSGSSFDLKNIREYGPSDDPRRIDWKLTGRTDRLYVKEFYEEERDGVCLLVDVSASMAVFGAEETLRIGASVAWMLGALGLPSSIWAFARQVERRLERPRGGSSPAPVLSFFEDLKVGGGSSIAATIAAARRSSRHRRLIAISDFLEPRFQPATCPFPRSLFIRLHRDFEELAAGSSEVEVIDPESGTKLRTPWDRPARELYRLREAELEASFGAGSAAGGAARGGGRRSIWYRRLEPRDDRGALYWALLEALHE